MINALASFFGTLLHAIYNFVAGIGPEPKMISFYAIAIIVTTLLFRLALLPLNLFQTKNQLKMAKLQPEMKKFKKIRKDPQLLAQKQSQLYKEAQFNPLSGCLPMLVQFPVLLAFYRIFMFPTKFAFTNPEFYASMQKNFFLFKISTTRTLRSWSFPLLQPFSPGCPRTSCKRATRPRLRSNRNK